MCTKEPRRGLGSYGSVEKAKTIVEVEGRRATAGPGDVILLLVDDPPLVTIPDKVKAFFGTYQAGGGGERPARRGCRTRSRLPSTALVDMRCRFFLFLPTACFLLS